MSDFTMSFLMDTNIARQPVVEYYNKTSNFAFLAKYQCCIVTYYFALCASSTKFSFFFFFFFWGGEGGGGGMHLQQYSLQSDSGMTS